MWIAEIHDKGWRDKVEKFSQNKEQKQNKIQKMGNKRNDRLYKEVPGASTSKIIGIMEGKGREGAGS